MVDFYRLLEELKTIRQLLTPYPHIAEVGEVVALINATLHDAGEE